MGADTIAPPESPWMNADESASYAKQHKSQIYRACRERRLEHLRCSGRGKILTRREWLDQWLDSLRVHVVPGVVGR